jgi:hypothetical protein
MKLPKIDQPIFEMKIPSSEKPVRYRPYLCKEEKLLLIAQESRDDADVVRAIKQILTNCVIEDWFDVDDLTTFDMEYMFLKLRAKSVDNIVKISIQDADDEEVYPFEVNLDEVEMLQPSEVSNTIQINEELGMKLRYPSTTILDTLPEGSNQADVAEHLIINCIDVIFDNDNVYPINELGKDELTEFIDNLPVSAMNNISNFFKSMPRMHYKIEYTNKLDMKKEIHLRSLSDFFILR